MLYITGDTHGNQLKWLEQIHPALSPGDGVIVAGDFGYGFWSGPLGSEDAFYDWLAAQPYAVFFIDGNHENFDRLLALPVEPWRGGRIQRIRPNVIHLMRGEVYLIEGRTVFTFGGGHSADFWRRKPGASWWPQEMPEPEEYRRASESLRRVHGRSTTSSRTPPRLRRGTISPRCTRAISARRGRRSCRSRAFSRTCAM